MTIKKRWLTKFGIGYLLLTIAVGGVGFSGHAHAEEKDIPLPPKTNAQSFSLMDVTSGRLLYSEHGDEELPIASLTKIMTAIVAIEHGNLSDKVKVSANAFGKEGSSLFLRLGEEMSLHDMLYGLMLRSGNDAATAIAEHVGGSEQGFVYLMNEKAALIGLQHTKFQNPHGLDQEGHYSTANDLAKLTAYALHNETFKQIVATQSKRAQNPIDPWDYKWNNKNKMLRLYEGADGVKTGYTKIAKRCLVSSATRDGQQLVVVTINDGDDWNDHRKLLDFGFEHYPLASLVHKGQQIAPDMKVGDSFSYALAPGEQDKIKRKLVLKQNQKDETQFGFRGYIEMYLDNEKIGTVPVYDKDSYIPDSKASSRPSNAKINSTTNSFGLSLRLVLKKLFLG